MPGELLVVDKTASDKSHILCMITTMVDGIVLIIVPILSLTHCAATIADCGSNSKSQSDPTKSRFNRGTSYRQDSTLSDY